MLKEFISEEQKQFKVRLGKTLASSLTGFLAGIIVASFVWMALNYLFSDPLF